jgi:hypothetical protein
VAGHQLFALIDHLLQRALRPIDQLFEGASRPISRRRQILFWVIGSIVVGAILYAATALMMVAFRGPNYGVQDPPPGIR